MTDFDAEKLAKAKGDKKSCDAGDERKKIVFAASYTGHSFEKLSPIQDSYSVKEHDQTGKSDWSSNRCFRGEGANGEANEQDSTDSQGKSAKIDLADQVANADCEKDRKNGLCADDIAR